MVSFFSAGFCVSPVRKARVCQLGLGCMISFYFELWKYTANV
jgi:hypothetical protein